MSIKSNIHQLEFYMCGRFSLLASPEELCNIFGMDALGAFPPRYNIAPTQPILTVGVGPNAVREAQLVRWGPCFNSCHRVL